MHKAPKDGKQYLHFFRYGLSLGFCHISLSLKRGVRLLKFIQLLFRLFGQGSIPFAGVTQFNVASQRLFHGATQGGKIGPKIPWNRYYVSCARNLLRPSGEMR